jgi:YggT family protein
MIDWALQIFIYITIADVLMSWVPDVRKQPWAQKLHQIADAPQKPIREMLPQDMPLDPCPMIIIILCEMLMFIF